MERIKIEVIFTFTKKDQSIILLEFVFRPSEVEFLFNAFARLKPSEQAQLCKISACQLMEDSSLALPWLLKSNGKYFFGVEIGE